jgi:hypothetical protein
MHPTRLLRAFSVARNSGVRGLPKDRPRDNPHRDTIKKLALNERMQEAWADIVNREACGNVTWVSMLYEQIELALTRPKKNPPLTTSKLKEAYAKVAALSEKLARDLNRLGDKEANDIVALLHPTTLYNGTLSFPPESIEEYPSGWRRINMSELTLKQNLRFLPSVPQLLSQLSEHAKYKSKRTLKQVRPASVGAQCRPFISHMSDYFFSRYSARLNPTVATMASVIFKRTISSGLVKKLIVRRIDR